MAMDKDTTLIPESHSRFCVTCLGGGGGGGVIRNYSL